MLAVRRGPGCAMLGLIDGAERASVEHWRRSLGSRAQSDIEVLNKPTGCELAIMIYLMCTRRLRFLPATASCNRGCVRLSGGVLERAPSKASPGLVPNCLGWSPAPLNLARSSDAIPPVSGLSPLTI